MLDSYENLALISKHQKMIERYLWHSRTYRGHLSVCILTPKIVSRLVILQWTAVWIDKVILAEPWKTPRRGFCEVAVQRGAADTVSICLRLFCTQVIDARWVRGKGTRRDRYCGLASRILKKRREISSPWLMWSSFHVLKRTGHRSFLTIHVNKGRCLRACIMNKIITVSQDRELCKDSAAISLGLTETLIEEDL